MVVVVVAAGVVEVAALVAAVPAVAEAALLVRPVDPAVEVVAALVRLRDPLVEVAGRAASAAVWRAAAAVIDRQRVRRAAMWQETGRMLAEPEIVQVARADRAASGIGRAELVERVALVGRVALRIGRAEPAALADPAVWEIGQAAPVDRVGSVELAARAALRIGQAGPVALVVSAALQIGRAASVGPVASVGRVASGIDRADLAVLVASAALVVSAALQIDLVLGRPSVPVLEPAGGLANRGNRLDNRVDNRGDRLENRGDRLENRGDWLNDRQDFWQDVHNDWHHGNWNGNWGHGEGWFDHPWAAWGVTSAAWGLTSWAAGSLFYDTGYYGYENPYYVPAATTTVVEYPVYDYSQPIVTTTAPPDMSAPAAVTAVSESEQARDAFYKGDYKRGADLARRGAGKNAGRRRAARVSGTRAVCDAALQRGCRNAVCGPFRGARLGLDDHERSVREHRHLYAAAAASSSRMCRKTRTIPTDILCSRISI